MVIELTSIWNMIEGSVFNWNQKCVPCNNSKSLIVLLQITINNHSNKNYRFTVIATSMLCVLFVLFLLLVHHHVYTQTIKSPSMSRSSSNIWSLALLVLNKFSYQISIELLTSIMPNPVYSYIYTNTLYTTFKFCVLLVVAQTSHKV